MCAFSELPEWTPPIDDGGLGITKYSIEKRDSEKLIWMKVAEVEKTIVSYCVQKLIPNSQYIFRVVAENPIGISEPKESVPVTIRVKIGKSNRLKCAVKIEIWKVSKHICQIDRFQMFRVHRGRR